MATNGLNGEPQNWGSTYRLPQKLDSYGLEASTAVGPKARKLLENWSGIPPDQVDEHVSAVREKAFQIHPYPCIGMFRFLDLSILSMPVYPEVVSRLKRGEKLLDLGCCFGQELRQLASDGVPPGSLYGTDIRQAFIDFGHDLFKDSSRSPATFFQSDIFSEEDENLKKYRGKFSIIYAGSFFHLFDSKDSKIATLNTIKLLKPQKGSMIVGRQIGNIHPGPVRRPHGPSGGHDPARKPPYRHNEESFRESWEEISREMGVDWDVEVSAENWRFGVDKDAASRFRTGEVEKSVVRERSEEGMIRLRYVVRRL